MPAKKKHPSVRARTNRAATAATLSRVVPIRQRPKLPPRTDAKGQPMAWHPHTVEWWKDLWAAPMAAEYHHSDRHALFLLATLVDDFWTATSPTGRKEAAIEIRLQRQAFGLTPYDRRRLEWTVEAAEEAKERGTTRRQASGTKGGKVITDPRLNMA